MWVIYLASLRNATGISSLDFAMISGLTLGDNSFPFWMTL